MKIFRLIIIAAVLFVVGVFVNRYFIQDVGRGPESQQRPPVSQEPPAQQPQPGQSRPQNEKSYEENGNVWVGILRESDRPSRGNLFLEFSENDGLYINTSRDYSHLIGEKVGVFYQGDRSSFRLLDIEAR
jgi:hypothetical protein